MPSRRAPFSAKTQGARAPPFPRRRKGRGRPLSAKTQRARAPPFPRRRKGAGAPFSAKTQGCGRSGGDGPRRPPAPSRLTGTSHWSYPAARTPPGNRRFRRLRQIKGVLPHAGLPEWGTADSADWSRLGAGCRRQDAGREVWRLDWAASSVAPRAPLETQGPGTVERPAGPNGEVPGPLRSFASSRPPLSGPFQISPHLFPKPLRV